MASTIASFQLSTEEDLRFQLDFIGLALSGRALRVNVRERGTNALKVSLTAPTYLTLANDGNLTVHYPRASMASWATGEYEADILDESGGSATRIMAVRFVYDEPGKLVYGVRGNQATIAWGDNQAVVTAIGGVGPPGPVNTLAIGAVATGTAGSNASAQITGDAPNQTLSLTIPRGNTGLTGNTGATGPANSLAIGTVATTAPGGSATATITGAAPSQTLSLTLPRGPNGAGGATSEILAASGIPEQPSFIADFIRDEFFASGAGLSTALPALVAALPGSSFARAGTATYVDRGGVMRTAQLNEPRIDHDPVTRQRLGLLIEPARTNLALQSLDAQAGSWGLGVNSSFQGVVTAPDGTATARILRANTSGNSYVTQPSNLAANTTYTFSCWLKRISGPATNGIIAWADYNGPSGNARVSLSSNLLTDQWVRYSTTFTNVAAVTGKGFGYAADFGGQGVSEVAMWGAQLEAGPGPTSFIPTTAATATRAVDALTLMKSDWLADGPSSALVEYDVNELRAAGDAFPLYYWSGSAGNYVATRVGQALNGADFVVQAGGVLQVDSGEVSVAAGERIRYGFQLSPAGWAATKNGATPMTGGAITLPTGLDRLAIGLNGFSGHIRRIVHFPLALTGAKLQSLTALDWPNVSAHPGTVSLGTVTTGAPGSAAAIVNVGTPSAATFNFTIPRGVAGPAVGPGSIGTVELADGAVTAGKVDTAFLATLATVAGSNASYVQRTSPTGAAILPSGTTAQRGDPLPGHVRFNPGTGEYEGGNGAAWVPIGGGGALVADTPPTANLREGLLWFSRSWGALFVYYADVDSAQWVSTCPVIDPEAFALNSDNLSRLTNPATARANLGVRAAVVGEMIHGMFTTLPALCLWPYGQNVLRADYPALLAATTLAATTTTTNASAAMTLNFGSDASLVSQVQVGMPIEGAGIPAGAAIATIGTISGNTVAVTISAAATASTAISARVFPCGNGNGTTTFGVADARGVVGLGRDNIGGTATNRVTMFNARRLGLVGGDQLPSPQLQIGRYGNANPAGSSWLDAVPGDSGAYGNIPDASTSGTGIAGNVQPSQVRNIVIFAGA